MRTEKDYIKTIKRLHAALQITEEKLNAFSEDIAIVGMACRFPGVNSLSEFDTLLQNGEDSWTEMPKDRWDAKHNKELTTEGGFFLDKIDKFDNTFFKISGAEAKMMSPQQRLLLETSWHALEHAHIVPKTLQGSNTGIFMGVGDDSFGLLAKNEITLQQKAHFVSGNALSTASGRLSYFYGFQGPNITLNTACSSSLVAIDQAVQSLRSGKCTTALAGGVNIILLPDSFSVLEDTQALAPDGKCKGFDSRADGYGRGEGCGIVVLKKVSDALKDGQKILAVIKGSAVNQDGASNGLTAPNGLAQQKLLKKAIENSGVESTSVSFIEAHGTGTPLGDPIEIEALNQSYARGRSSDEPLYVSSVKSNLGHLENSAGIAGVIKAVLSIQNGVIYPQANLNEINPKLHFPNDALIIPKEKVAWPENKIKRAGISSFGFSGTNAHVILEEYKNQPQSTEKKSDNYLFFLSAKTEESLENLKTKYVEFIHQSKPDLADLCYTLACHRTQFKHYVAYLVSSLSELETKLTSGNGTAENETEILSILKADHLGDVWKQKYGKHAAIEVPSYEFEDKRFEIHYAKIDKSEVEEEEAMEADVAAVQEENVHEYIGRLMSQVTEIPVEKLDFDVDVFDYGVDSLMIMHLQKEVQSRYQVEIKISMIYDALNTINNLANYISENRPTGTGTSQEKKKTAKTSLSKKEKKFVPYVSTKKKKVGVQKLDDTILFQLIEEYNQKSQHSKDWTQKFRSFLANNRNIANFRPPIKEMTYQIVAEKSKGAYIYDAKGEKYLDMSMGFGVHLFGHNPDFLKEAMTHQLEKSIALGPMSPMAGQLAKSICEFTNNDRASFYNSGTEAVMVAIRLARAVTKKQKVVMFAGSYHGTFDGILGVSEDGKTTIPMAPGIPENMVKDLIVLSYGDPNSIAMIEEQSDEIAAVLTEPIQSRYPELQPKEFLQAIRETTQENNIALIFDEVITGFRLAKGGAQEYYGIDADICTFGKVIGGGMPIGVVSGKELYMNAVDGGYWSYGDKSFPMAENTFVAGTFCHHPLAMATGLSVINHLENHPNLIPDLNQRNKEMCEELNDWFRSQNMPVSMVYMGSLFRFKIPTGFDFIYYYLLSKGIYIWEGRNCFISTAHTEEDLQFFVKSVKEGFLYLFPKVSQSTAEEGFEPTPGQLEIWMAVQKTSPAHIYHLTETFEITGPFHVNIFKEAFDEVSQTFDALSMVCKETNDGVRFIKQELTNSNYLKLRDSEDFHEIDFLVKEQHEQAFDLDKAPLWRAEVITGTHKSMFVFTIHHLICDGGSLEIIFRKLMQRYFEKVAGVESNPDTTIESFERYTTEFNHHLRGNTWEDQQSYWSSKLKDVEPVHLDVSFDASRPGKEALVKRNLKGEELTAFFTLQRQLKATPFALAAALTHLACQLKLNMTRVLTLSPVTGRYSQEWSQTVGHLLNMIPLQSEKVDFDDFSVFSSVFNAQVEKAYQHMEYPFTLLESEWSKDKAKGSWLSAIEVSYENFGMRDSSQDEQEITIQRLEEHCVDMRKFPIEFRFYQFNDSIDYRLVYDPEVLNKKLAEELIDMWKIMMEHVQKNPSISFVEISEKIKNKLKEKEGNKQAALKNKELAMLLGQKK